MADGLDFAINGVEDILSKLTSITHDVNYKGGRFALRKAAQIVRDQAQENAKSIDDPETAEDISKNIVERWNGRLFKRSGNIGFRVGVLGGARAPAIRVGEIKGSGKKNPGGDTFYWRYHEFGTEKMAANPFMQKALSDNIGKSTDEFVKHYRKALDRAIKRAKKSAPVSGRRR